MLELVGVAWVCSSGDFLTMVIVVVVVLEAVCGVPTVYKAVLFGVIVMGVVVGVLVFFVFDVGYG